MNQCAVKSCQLTPRYVYHSPKDQERLKMWKSVLCIDKNDFYVCERHFKERDMKTGKILLTSAVPKLYLTQDVSPSMICESCLEPREIKLRKSDDLFSSFQVELLLLTGVEVRERLLMKLIFICLSFSCEMAFFA